MPDDARMQLIQAASPITRADRLALIRAGVFGVVLLVGGAAAAWIFVSTPLIGSFVPDGRPSVVQVGAGMAIWALAIVAPTGLMVMGLVRLFRSYETATALRQTGNASSLEHQLGPEHVAIVNLVLPGGRRINEMILGPCWATCRRPRRAATSACAGRSAARADAGPRWRARSSARRETPSASGPGWATTTATSSCGCTRRS
jgi:hypothetical protein